MQINNQNDFVVSATPYRSLGVVLEEIAIEKNLGTLSGGTEKGWSRASTFERCPHAYYLRYVKHFEPEVEKKHRDIGSGVHAFLALHYTGVMAKLHKGPIPITTPEWLREVLLEKQDVNPEALHEAWRVFEAYRSYYAEDYFRPIDVEYTVVDDKTGHSCRYDLVAYVDKNDRDIESGWYICEHKTASQFSMDTLTAWELDGEILGQILLWERCKLEQTFGPLKGVIINILGKQKSPDFYRTIVDPKPEFSKRHLKVLNHLDDRIATHRKARYWPQYWNGCVTRWGRCDYWDHCSSGVSL